MPTEYINESVTSHSVPLSGLTADTQYQARVRSTDASGNTSAWSGWVPFTTTSGGPDPDTITWSAPITISSGGTYTGNWRSTDPTVAAVTITTAEPVTITGSAVRGKWHLIYATAAGCDVTITHTYGWADNPNVAGQSAGLFAHIERFKRAVVENCYMKGTAGIQVRDTTAVSTNLAETYRVKFNRAVNIDGRHSDGAGGWRTGPTDFTIRQFFQSSFNVCAGFEVGWNEVINTFGQSRVEDNINIFQSSATATARGSVHDNFVWGGYPADLTYGYSGGGIILGDFGGSYVDCHDNQVVGTTNYGLSIVCGVDNAMYDNRVVGSGTVTEGGTRFTAANLGLSGASSNQWDPGSCAECTNNTFTNNTVGWVKADGARNDVWSPDATTTGTVHLADPITYADEQAEKTIWDSKVSAAGVALGPNWGA